MSNISHWLALCLVDVETGSVVAPTVDDDDVVTGSVTRKVRAVKTSGRSAFKAERQRTKKKKQKPKLLCCPTYLLTSQDSIKKKMNRNLALWLFNWPVYMKTKHLVESFQIFFFVVWCDSLVPFCLLPMEMRPVSIDTRLRFVCSLRHEIDWWNLLSSHMHTSKRPVSFFFSWLVFTPWLTVWRHVTSTILMLSTTWCVFFVPSCSALDRTVVISSCYFRPRWKRFRIN